MHPWLAESGGTRQHRGMHDDQPDARRPASTGVLDDISKRIIELLQEDGRQSYATMAKHVGLSEAAVRQRVQRLRDTGVMQIVAVTDPMQVGFHRQALVGIKVSGDLQAVAADVSLLAEADYVVTTAGSFDVIAELVCEDDEQVLAIIQRIRAVPGVLSTEAFVYLKLHKQHYNWGTR